MDYIDAQVTKIYSQMYIKNTYTNYPRVADNCKPSSQIIVISHSTPERGRHLHSPAQTSPSKQGESIPQTKTKNTNRRRRRHYAHPLAPRESSPISES